MVSEPLCELFGDNAVLMWRDLQVGFRFDRMHGERSGVVSEMMVFLLPPGTGSVDMDQVIWGPVVLNITDNRDIRDMARVLGEQIEAPAIDWNEMLMRGCATAVNRWRSADKTVKVNSIDAVIHMDIISHFIRENESTMMFADAGSGKSYIGLALSLALAAGVPLLNGRLTPAYAMPVLYLDYECDGPDVRQRVDALAKGMGLLKIPDGLMYRRMNQPFAFYEHDIREYVIRAGIKLVVIDSVVPASGGEAKEPGTANTFMQSIKRIDGPAKLLLAHVSKAARDTRSSERTPYGSMFFYALARSVWSIQRIQAEGGSDIDIGLYHTKANNTGLHPPFGIKMRFTDEPREVSLEPLKIDDNAELAEHGTFALRIISAIKTSLEPLSCPRIAEMLKINEGTVRTTLNRFRESGVIVEAGSDGRTKLWGMAAHFADDGVAQGG